MKMAEMCYSRADHVQQPSVEKKQNAWEEVSSSEEGKRGGKAYAHTRQGNIPNPPMPLDTAGAGEGLSFLFTSKEMQEDAQGTVTTNEKGLKKDRVRERSADKRAARGRESSRRMGRRGKPQWESVHQGKD